MPIRIIIQRVNEAELIDVGKISKGIILYLAFLKETKKDDIERIINKILSIQLMDGKNLFELKWNLLIIPQASLGGKVKGKKIQYHGLIGKSVGKEFYEHFVCLWKDKIKKNNDEIKVVSGEYGETQKLSINATCGPYTHYMDMK